MQSDKFDKTHAQRANVAYTANNTGRAVLLSRWLKPQEKDVIKWHSPR
jgi:hypothetical protein